MATERNKLQLSDMPGSRKVGTALKPCCLGLLLLLGLSVFFAMGCSGGAGTGPGGGGTTQAATPTIATTPALNGALVVTLASATPGAVVYYTVDGTTPTTNSARYLAPFLVATNQTLQAIAQAEGGSASAVASQTFTLDIPSGTLVWSDEFNNSTGASAQPNPAVWSYNTGSDTNQSLDILCAYGSNTSPCDSDNPNAFVDTNGYLNIVARQPSPGVYTSAEMVTSGLFSFQYGRLEARIQVPEAQGLWPAFWLLGNNIGIVGWPGCGEMDVMERINAAGSPDWNQGSIHGTGFTGANLGTTYNFPSGQTAAGWHTYGMIKSPNSISYYVDDPTKPYVTYAPASITPLPGAVWPFDNGQANYIILNIAVGGSWPGPPNASTPFPSTMLVDYVRVYTN
jgi:beta-glucanase (GH16 family)